MRQKLLRQLKATSTRDVKSNSVCVCPIYCERVVAGAHVLPKICTLQQGVTNKVGLNKALVFVRLPPSS